MATQERPKNVSWSIRIELSSEKLGIEGLIAD